MSDVFLSYASSDRPRAASLAGALSDVGWDVWWDRSILPGKTFDQVIEEELAATRCVVVAWTKESVGSRWVRTEAAEALDRGMLVPVMFDDVEIPLAFRRIQAADLTDWHRGERHPSFDELITAIAAFAGKPIPPATPPSDVEARGTALDESDDELTVERWQDARDQTEEIDQIGSGYVQEPGERFDPARERFDGQQLVEGLPPGVRVGPSDSYRRKRRARRLAAFAVVALVLIVAAVVAVFVASRREEVYSFEAEEGGIREPMSIERDAAASSGGFVTSHEGEEGSVTIGPFSVEGGDYVVEACGAARGSNPSGSDSMYVSVDGGEARYVWDFFEDQPLIPTNWACEVISARCGGAFDLHECDPLRFTLEPGAHTLTFETRDRDFALDWITVRRIGPG